MSTRTFRLLALAALCMVAVIYAPMDYSWRWQQNEEMYRQGRIIKDSWVGGQVFIPVESWGLGVFGISGLLFAFWRMTRRSKQV